MLTLQQVLLSGSKHMKLSSEYTQGHEANYYMIVGWLVFNGTFSTKRLYHAVTITQTWTG